jgi:hypothetical protein
MVVFAFVVEMGVPREGWLISRHEGERDETAQLAAGAPVGEK